MPKSNNLADHFFFDLFLGNLVVTGKRQGRVKGDYRENIAVRAVAQRGRRASVRSVHDVRDINPAGIRYMDIFGVSILRLDGGVAGSRG